MCIDCLITKSAKAKTSSGKHINMCFFTLLFLYSHNCRKTKAYQTLTGWNKKIDALEQSHVACIIEIMDK